MLKQSEMLFKACGDRTRLRVLKILEPGPLCVCQIVETLGLSQSVVSKHLSVLAGVGLLSDSRRGKWTFYSLSKPASDLCRRVQAAIRRCDAQDSQVKRDLEKASSTKVRSLLQSCPPR